ncbi:hypothetical protein GA0115249_11893 [Streptomyces sp. PpalLS-921]|nr:hypothetical protein GA0115249_11893 [Streptomyces sp. PpalLS-921]
MSFGDDPARLHRVDPVRRADRGGGQGQFAPEPLGRVEHGVQQQPQPHVLDRAPFPGGPAARLDRGLRLGETGLEPPGLALGGGDLGGGRGPRGVGPRALFAQGRLAALHLAQGAAQLALEGFGLLAPRVELRAQPLGLGPGPLAGLGELLAQPGQLAPALLVRAFGVGALDLLAHRGHQLDPAVRPQHVGHRGHVHRVGRGGRRAGRQRLGQLGMAPADALADAPPERRIALQRGGHRVAGEPGPAGRGETGVLSELRGQFTDGQPAEGVRDQGDDLAAHTLGQRAVERLRDAVGLIGRFGAACRLLHHPSPQSVCPDGPVRSRSPAGRPARSGPPRCTNGTAPTRWSH